MSYDLKIINATIVDGTGAPRRTGAVAVAAGRIAAVGAAPGEARTVIDAGGHAVAPGFIDMHTHYDAQILWDRKLSISPWHGVTTVVMGNCGFTIAPNRPSQRDLILRTLERVEGMSLDALRAGTGPDWGFESFPSYLDAVERRGSLINVGCYIGHTAVRLHVMGTEAVEREATADEIAAMERLVHEGIEAGALGFSSSRLPTHNGFDGKPVPSRLATIDEFHRLIAAMTAGGGNFFQVSMGRGFFLDEYKTIAQTYGTTIAWTALLTHIAGPGSHRKYLDRTQAMIAAGANVIPQTSPRPLTLEFNFDSAFAFEARPFYAPTMRTDRAGRKALFRDPAFRQTFKDDRHDPQPHQMVGWDERAVISYSPVEPALTERPVREVAAERGVDPVDLVLDLSLASDLALRLRVPILNYDEVGVAEILKDKNTVLGLSDAGAHANSLCDACYPTYLLGRWVREKRTLTLEEGVRALSARPAEVLGLGDRGRIAPGLVADLVVFDPATVLDGPIRRVYDLPAGADRLISDAIGIDAVIVNGTVIRRHGVDVVDDDARLPGHLLRGRRAH